MPSAIDWKDTEQFSYPRYFLRHMLIPDNYNSNSIPFHVMNHHPVSISAVSQYVPSGSFDTISIPLGHHNIEETLSHIHSRTAAKAELRLLENNLFLSGLDNCCQVVGEGKEKGPTAEDVNRLVLAANNSIERNSMEINSNSTTAFLGPSNILGALYGSVVNPESIISRIDESEKNPLGVRYKFRGLPFIEDKFSIGRQSLYFLIRREAGVGAYVIGKSRWGIHWPNDAFFRMDFFVDPPEVDEPEIVPMGRFDFLDLS